MGIVWAVNKTYDDVAMARQFGEIRYINLRYIYGDEITDEKMPAENTARIQDAVDQFNSDTDYVLIAGDHLQLMFFAAALGVACKPFRVLRWDKKAEGYIPVHIECSVDGA